MDNYRGVKASELIKQLQAYKKEFGDLYVCKEKGGIYISNTFYKSLSKHRLF